MATLVAAAAVLALPAPRAYAGDPCVGVIVDARLLGAGVSTGCAAGDPDTGLDALTRAGFRYAFAPRQPGLVCQIDALPECARTSTTTYWSYWYRPKGSRTWTYATRGAGSRDPEPGSTEAWVWQDGGRRQPPDIALRTLCPQAATASSPPKTPAPTPSRASTTAPRQTARPAGSATATSSTGGSGPRTRTASPTSAAASASVAATVAPSTAASTAASSSPASGTAAAQGGDGPPVGGLLAGVGLIGLLGAAAAATARRRARP